MDDCIEFAKRLKELGVPTHVDVMHSVPHGYLNFGKVYKHKYHADFNQLNPFPF